MTLRDIALYTHLISLGLTACAIVYSDFLGLQWILGKAQILEKKKLLRLHSAVGVGLGLMLGSGGVLFWINHTYLLTDVPFYVKMFFVLALIINSLVIKKHLTLATELEFKNVPAKEKKYLFISGVVSSLSWIGAAISATFLF